MHNLFAHFQRKKSRRHASEPSPAPQPQRKPRSWIATSDFHLYPGAEDNEWKLTYKMPPEVFNDPDRRDAQAQQAARVMLAVNTATAGVAVGPFRHLIVFNEAS